MLKLIKMNKFTKAILFCFSLTFLSVLFHSCCTDTYKIIGSGSMSILDLSTYTETDTIKGAFVLSNHFDTEITDFSPSFNLINSAYATTCEDNFENDVDLNTLKITCDKDFTHDGTTITAGENFSDLFGIDIGDVNYFGGIFEVNFTQTFLDNCTFQEETYTFKVESTTTDDLKLSNEASAFVKL